ncbi:MAG: hypothetical protein ABSF43_16425 [Rectinemataceae bacterium]|jgi:hypothetical protein
MANKKSALKVGYAGLHFPVMGAREYGVFEAGLAVIEKLAAREGFELAVWPRLISEAEESIKAARFFAESGADFLLVQASSLTMGDAILPLVEPIERLGLWVLDEPTYEGELPLNSLTGFNLCVSLIRAKWGDSKRLKWFWGDGVDFEIRFLTSIRALSGLKAFRGSRIAAVGETVPSFSNLDYEKENFEKALGIEVLPFDLEELFRRSDEAPSDEIEAIRTSLVARAACVRVDEPQLLTTARICYALQTVKEREGADAAALRCWPEFQSWKGLAPCAAVAWSNDSCMPTACEGDLPGAVAMLLGRIVSGRAATMNDPVALDRRSESIQMWHCGPGPASWADESGQCLDYHHTLNRRIAPGAALAGVSSDIRFALGSVTMLRIRGDGESLFALEGDVVERPAAPYPGSGGWIGNLDMGGVRVSLEDLLQMMAYYGLEHHYPVMRGRHFETLREMAVWAGWTILPFISARSNSVI